MAYSPIAFTAANYRDYKFHWIKAYEPGTTTPKAMALFIDGSTPVSKLQINSDGFIVSAGSALVIPYINGAYDLWMFSKEVDADNNDTSEAVRLADNITAVGISSGSASDISETPPANPYDGARWTRCTDMKAFLWYVDADGGQWIEDRPSYGIDTIQNLTLPYVFNTVADITASTIIFPVGKRIEWKGYYTQSDGGGNFGIVKVGVRIDDGGSTFTIPDGKYIEADFKNGINVRTFGAKGDGVNDDQPAIQAAADYATTNGGDVSNTAGYYRLTAPVNIGAPFYINSNDIDFIVNRTSLIDDAADIAAQDQTNKAANRLLHKIDFKCSSDCYFVADFSPTAFTPVVAYNLDNDSFDNAGSCTGLNVIAMASFVGGKYDDTVTYTANKLVGLYTGRGCSVTKKFMAAGLGAGYVSNRQYWTSSDSIKVYHCGDGIHLSAYNQAKASNLNVHTCLRAYIFDGQGGEMDTFGAENCDEELIVFSADTCKFSTAYLEDVRSSGGTGKFSVVLGHTANNPANLVVHSTFDNILILNVLGSVKKSIKFNSCDQVILTACRAYGGDIVTDTNSLCRLDGCDFSVEQFYVNSEIKKTFVPLLRDSGGNDFTLASANGVLSVVGTTATIHFDIDWSDKGAAVAGEPVVVTFDRVFPTMVMSSAVFVSGLAASSQVHARTELATQFLTLKKVGAGVAANLIVSDLSASGSLSFSISVPISLFA